MRKVLVVLALMTLLTLTKYSLTIVPTTSGIVVIFLIFLSSSGPSATSRVIARLGNDSELHTSKAALLPQRVTDLVEPEPVCH